MWIERLKNLNVKKKILYLIITVPICMVIGSILWICGEKNSKITVNFVDENGTKLLIKPITYTSKPWLPLFANTLNDSVPGYKLVRHNVFFNDKHQYVTLKFKAKNFDDEMDNLNRAKYIATTFQPMTVPIKNGWQADPYNLSRTYHGEKTGKDSLRIIYSDDGKDWKFLHISYPKINIRDPHITKIGNFWYIIYTKGLIRTKDFKNWERVPWAHSEYFTNKYEWAPEFVKDKYGNYKVVMSGWSRQDNDMANYISDIDVRTGKIANNWRRIQGDFSGNNIDANITYYHGRYIMFYKSYNTEKIMMSVSKKLEGPYKSKELSIDNGNKSVEAPEAVIENGKIRLYYDTYMVNSKGTTVFKGIHYIESNNVSGLKWTSPHQIKAPFVVRHFGIYKQK